MDIVPGSFTLCIICVPLFIFTGAPRLVMVTSVNSTTVIVSWSEVQCFNGSGAVTHYLVQCRYIHDGAIRNVTTNSSEQEMIVSGLSLNFALWTFRVAAVYNQSVGPFSNFFSSTTSLGNQVNSEFEYVCFITNCIKFTPPDEPPAKPSLCPTEDSGNFM